MRQGALLGCGHRVALVSWESPDISVDPGWSFNLPELLSLASVISFTLVAEHCEGSPRCRRELERKGYDRTLAL